MKRIAWNGREIRNGKHPLLFQVQVLSPRRKQRMCLGLTKYGQPAFQTAVALAEYEAQKDAEGRIMLTDDHIKAVVEMSSDFKRYLKALHKKDESGRAAMRQERLDSWIKTPDA